MPVFNGMPYLHLALDSILRQTYTDWELVICDNASRDETSRVCQEYAARDARIRYFRYEENAGAAANYNRVFERSRGGYFKWAAADDVLAPTMIEECVAALDASPRAPLAFPGTIIINDAGRELHRIEDEIDVSSDDPVDRVTTIRQNLRECNAIFGLIRSDVLRRTPLIGRYIAADAHLLGELAMYGPFVRIPDFLFCRRDHAAASSADKSPAAQLSFYDPRLRKRFVMSGWRGSWADFRAAFRAPLTIRQRMALWWDLARRMYWSRHALGKEMVLWTRQFAPASLTHRTG